MPYCEVGNEGIRIFYRTYGRGPVKVLLIIGLASTHDAWGPQIVGLTGTDRPNDDISCAADDRVSDLQVDREDEGGVQLCAFDNRGVGQSSVPVEKSEYSTKIMAKDAIALLDHLGWDRAHVFGHSMGAMIACKLAAMVPQRVLSLALLNVTGGGFECFPRFDRQTISIAIRFLRAKTPEERAAVDLDTHYTKEYLEEYVGSNTRREILHKEYVKAISASGMQSSYGFDGQINACWNHSMTELEIESIRSAGFLVSVIHGRHDVIAQIFYAKKLAEKLQPVARMIDLHGGHLVSHERPEEVNQALLDLIWASEKKTSPYEWTNMAKNISESIPLLSRTLADGERNAWSKKKPVLERLNQFLWYLLGLFLTAYDCIRKTISSVKPVKLEASLPCSHGISSDPTLLNLSRESHSAGEREQESGCVSKGFWVEQEIHLCKDVTKGSGSR